MNECTIVSIFIFTHSRHVCVHGCVCLCAHMLPLSAVRCVDLTVDATESSWTAAGIAIHTVRAVPTIAAGGAHAFVDIFGAALTTESSHTHTCEAVDAVNTHATIAAGV